MQNGFVFELSVDLLTFNFYFSPTKSPSLFYIFADLGCQPLQQSVVGHIGHDSRVRAALGLDCSHLVAVRLEVSTLEIKIT